VILIDANILLYACNAAADLHTESRNWLDAKLNGAAPVGLPWPSLLAFLRISTNPRAFRSPLSMTAAWDQVASWLSAQAAWSPEPSERHAAVLSKLLALPGMKSRAGCAPRALAIEQTHAVLDKWGFCAVPRG